MSRAGTRDFRGISEAFWTAARDLRSISDDSAGFQGRFGRRRAGVSGRVAGFFGQGRRVFRAGSQGFSDGGATAFRAGSQRFSDGGATAFRAGSQRFSDGGAAAFRAGSQRVSCQDRCRRSFGPVLGATRTMISMRWLRE
ncbi:MAG: hypothetical protein MPJ79_04495 [Alphaproteobacteria bacterium]|nr:hypothetical protein [Alphaproteobacteria bacterium]